MNIMPKSHHRKRSAAAAAASSGGSDGFGSGSGGLYAVSSDKYKAKYNAFWQPSPNQNLQNDSVIHFQLTTRSDQMIR